MTESTTTQNAEIGSTKKSGRGKNFKVDQIPTSGKNDDILLDVVFDADLNIALPQNPSSVKNLNLYKHKGMGFDPLLPGLYQVFAKEVNSSIKSGQKSLSIATIAGQYNSGLAKFGKYLAILSSVLERDIVWTDINRNVIDQYISYLRHGDRSYSGQRTVYTQTKGLLIHCLNYGLLEHINQARDLFPKNPYPNVNKRRKGSQPFSKQEFKCLARAIRKEFALIAEGDQPLSKYELSVCVLALAIRTGINLTPALELPTDCLQIHPLKPADRMLLVWFKRRSNNTYIQAARKSDEITGFESVQYDVVDVIELVIKRNTSVRQSYEDPTRLFVFDSGTKCSKSEICALSQSNLNLAINAFTEKHTLLDDDGKPLKVNFSRLRKTFVNRIFELSGQDPLVTARYGGHSVQTANNYYWTPPLGAEADHRKLIEDRTRLLIATDLQGGENETPLAKCRDTKYGQRAPKNGDHCTEILGCFRCKSFVVTKDDLHRLFSFYWALIEDRRITDNNRWKKQFRHIRQIIDENVAPQFDAADIAAIRANAKTDRHPAWRDLTILRMAR